MPKFRRGGVGTVGSGNKMNPVAARMAEARASGQILASDIADKLTELFPHAEDVIRDPDRAGDYAVVFTSERNLPSYELVQEALKIPGIERFIGASGDGELTWYSYKVTPEVKKNF